MVAMASSANALYAQFTYLYREYPPGVCVCVVVVVGCGGGGGG